MTHFYKVVNNGIIKQIGSMSAKSTVFPEITEEDYKRITEVMQNHPENTLEVAYELKNDTETYEGRETTRKEKAEWYLGAVQRGELPLEEVPEEYQAEIAEKLPNNPYGLANDLYLQVKTAEEKRVEEEILKEVQNEY